MNHQKIKLLVLLAAAHFLACILSGALGWEKQLLVVCLSGITATWISYKQFNGNLLKILIVILPFYLLYSPFSIYLKSYETFPIWILGSMACAATYFSMRFVKPAWKRLALLLIIPLLGHFIIMPNNFAFLFQKRNLSIYRLHNSLIRDDAGAQVDLKSLNGKITLLDIWSTNCLPCIKKFPDLQKLQDRYKDDSMVNIISLNIPLARDSSLNPRKFTNRYSFQKFYFNTEEEARKLTIQEVPLVLILDKNLDCRFAGDLNTGWNIFIGNAERIIDRLKSEK